MTENLSEVSNTSLTKHFKQLVEQERELQLEILHYLKEIYERRLYLENGYPSLFAFMTGELGYSEGAAGRRIRAMKLMREVPEAKEKLETGTLSITVASQIQSFAQNEDKKRKFEQAQPLTSAQKLELVNQLEGTSSRACEEKLAQMAPVTTIPRERTKILSHEKTQIQFVANKELLRKLEILKELTSHTNPEGKYEVLFEKLAEIALEKLDPERRAKRRDKRKTRPSQPLPSSSLIHIRGNRPVRSQWPATVGKASVQDEQENPNLAPPTSAQKCQPAPASARQIPSPRNGGSTRHIPLPLRDYIWKRDQGKCQYKNKKSGEICGSTRRLELDHVYPYSWGGKHSPDNLRLLCQNHNLHQAQKVTGLRKIKDRPLLDSH